jgi:RNA-directed DNA polymerase
MKLNFNAAAKRVTTTSLTDLPRLLSHRALESAHNELAKQTKAELSSAFIPSVEFLPMPKSGFGNRPIAIVSPQTRVLLDSLVDHLDPALPVESRAVNFSDFEARGTEEPDAWLIDFDITACYEFIDHEVLARELILQGADSDIVEVTKATLGAVFGRGIGLPQGEASSHRLSDAYLDIIERNLTRHGYPVYRYADDFRVSVKTRKASYHVIETAMEEAREVHLALAGQKIYVNSAKDAAAEVQERANLFNTYTTSVYGDLAETVITKIGYDDYDVDVAEPDEDTVNFGAIEQLLTDWADPTRERSTVLAHAGTIALSGAKSLRMRLPNALLAALIAKEPLRLRAVMDYLTSRAADDLNWALLNDIAKQDRNTPWHKVWLLSSAALLPSGAGTGPATNDFLTYATQQLADSYEVVRLEAAWLLALHKQITIDDVQRLYAQASSTSQVGLAAVAGRLSSEPKGPLSRAIRDDSALNKCAHAWGLSFDPNA